MNEPVSAAPLIRAKDIKARAAAWLERRDSGDWNDTNQAALDAWLSESNANLIAYRRVAEVWNRTERLVALRRPGFVQPAAKAGGARGLMFLRAAVGAAVLAIAGIGVASLWSASGIQAYVTPIGSRDILTLPDGSRIELNTNTAVRVSDTADQRTVWLDRGEAYFQVTHDPSHPFVVIAGDRRVVDVGTKFLMRRQPDRLQVTVMDGEVRFDAGNINLQPSPSLLGAGDTVTATANAVALTRKPATDLANELGWRRGVFVFRRTTLADAAAEYNRYNRQKITIADPATAKLTLSGTLPTNNVEAFLGVVGNFFSLNIEHHGDEIVISREILGNAVQRRSPRR